MDKITDIYLPRWAKIFYTCLAVILVPWIFNLAQNLPTRHTVRHWDTVWVGFDLIMLLAIGITIWFVIKRRVWVIISATALATLFIVDAWFDILTARPGKELGESLLFGLLEVILALFTYRFVYEIMHHSTNQKKFKITTQKK